MGMTFHEIITTYIVPGLCAVVLWVLRNQNVKIAQVHVLVNQRMTDMISEVARLAKALAETSPNDPKLARQATQAENNLAEATMKERQNGGV